MAVLAIIDPREDTPTMDRAIDIIERVDGPVGTSEFRDGACQERTHQFRGLHGTWLEGAGALQHVIYDQAR